MSMPHVMATALECNFNSTNGLSMMRTDDESRKLIDAFKLFLIKKKKLFTSNIELN